MTEFSRRQLLVSASGIGAAATAYGAMNTPASALSTWPGGAVRGASQRAIKVNYDDPTNIGTLEHVRQELVPPPFVPAHDRGHCLYQPPWW